MSHTGENTGTGLRGAAGAVHGAGEAIRGQINTMADTALGDRDAAAKNQAITDRGMDEISTGRYHGTGAGVTPADTTAERHNRAAQGEYPSRTHGDTGLGGAGIGSHHPTATGPGYGNTGAYEDPRSTNSGPHSSNLGNAADPRIDSDRSQQPYGTHGSSGLGSTGTHGSAVPGSHGSSGFDSTGTHGSAVPGSHGTSGLGSTGTHGSAVPGSHGTSGLGSTGTHGSAVPGSHGTHGTTGTSGLGSTGTHGAHGTHDTTGSGVTGSHGHGQYDDPRSTNAGPHSSNVGNTVDPRVDSDRSQHRQGSAATAGLQSTGGLSGATARSGSGINPTDIPGGYTTAETTTGHSGHGGETGLHGAHGPQHTGNTSGHFADGQTQHTSTGNYDENPKSSNHGPHGSNVLNKIDPRVDSDADNRARTGNQAGAAGGPHNSAALNKGDPRVDSDFDHRGAPGTHGTSHATHGTTGAGYGNTGTHGTTGTGYDTTGAHGTHGTTGHNTTGAGYGNTSSNAGPHNTSTANKLDPRVDSDVDNRARTGNTSGAAVGPHSSGAANKADPRIDSDLDNRGHPGTHTGTTGAHTTPGAHNTTGTHGVHDSTGTHGTTGTHAHDTTGTHAHDTTGTHGTTGHNTTEHDKAASSHPSHGEGMVGKILDKVDPRVKNV